MHQAEGTHCDDLEARRKISLARFSAELPVYSGAAAHLYEVVPMAGKSTPVSEIEPR
jgi:hypothetical protein